MLVRVPPLVKRPVPALALGGAIYRELRLGTPGAHLELDTLAWLGIASPACGLAGGMQFHRYVTGVRVAWRVDLCHSATRLRALGRKQRNENLLLKHTL